MTLNSALIWVARVTLAVLVIATLLPQIRTGYWIVRVCDFPRMQLLFLLFVPLLATVAHAWTTRSFRREHWILLVGVVATACWQAAHALPFTPLWPKELADSSGQPNLRVMVANIEFDNTQYDAVSQVIQEYDPEVLLLVEINSDWRTALGSLREAYPYHIEAIRDEGLGLALWSKIPVQREEVEYLVTERRPSIFATVVLPDGAPIRFAGVHPTPPGLDDETQGGRRDSRVRDAELVLVAKEVQADPDSAWVVTGDFNDVAWSHTTRLFKRLSGLRDPRVGRKLLNTYHADYPLLRYPIDHVFLSKGSTVERLQRVSLPGSDHFAILADVYVTGHPKPDPSSPSDRSEAKEIVEEGEHDADKRDLETQQEEN